MDEDTNAASPQPSPPAPQPPRAPLEKSEPAAKTTYVPHLELKAIVLLVFTLGLVIGSAIYLLRARGFFDPKQHLCWSPTTPRAWWPGWTSPSPAFPSAR